MPRNNKATGSPSTLPIAEWSSADVWNWLMIHKFAPLMRQENWKNVTGQDLLKLTPAVSGDKSRVRLLMKYVRLLNRWWDILKPLFQCGMHCAN